jgi:Sigma-70, region 4.
MKSSPPTSNYSVDEVEVLVEQYDAVKALRDRPRLNWLVRYCDLNLALRHMPPKEYQAVLLVGLIGLSVQHAGQLLGVSGSTMWRRYRRGLVWLTNHLNGVDD